MIFNHDLETINFKPEQENIFQYLRMTWCNSDIQIVYKVVSLRASSQIHLNQKPVFHPKILQLKWPRKASLLKQSKWKFKKWNEPTKAGDLCQRTPNSSHVLCMYVKCPSISFPKNPKGWSKSTLRKDGQNITSWPHHSCTKSFPLQVPLLGMLSCKEDKSPADSSAIHLNRNPCRLNGEMSAFHEVEKFIPCLRRGAEEPVSEQLVTTCQRQGVSCGGFWMPGIRQVDVCKYKDHHYHNDHQNKLQEKRSSTRITTT